MTEIRLIAVCISIFFSYNESFSQEYEAGNQGEKEQSESIRIMFWNVENLFDPFDDSLTRDEEFTPQGLYGWTWARFNRKLNNIYKVIISAGWEPPDMIGLAEVENRWVLERLTRETPLSKFEYRIIHKDSPDLRGIDVALLFLQDSFKPINRSSIHVSGLKDDDEPTRDILYVKGIVKSGDTVHIFVNHWPSRYTGQVETMHKRNTAAVELKRLTDSLLDTDPFSRIIIMGDFNDEPQDESISETLGAIVPEMDEGIITGSFAGKDSDINDSSMPRLLFDSSQLKGFSRLISDSLWTDKIPPNSLYCCIPDLTNMLPGTLKFEGRWYLFDQFIVSGGLLYGLSLCKSEILYRDFLFEQDEAYTGRKPYRTYNGYIYKGGYSDHLPIILDLEFFRKDR
jgi:hypothetical protein